MPSMKRILLELFESKLGWWFASFVIFSLTIKGWVSFILFSSTLLGCILIFINHQSDSLNDQQNKNISPLIKYRFLYVVTFCLPILVVIITSLLKGEWHASNFDGPSRYLMGLLIFYVISHFRINITTALSVFIPLMPIATVLILPYLPHQAWATLDGRLSSYFIDPLTFGVTCLAMGIMSLLVIRLNSDSLKYTLFVQLLGGALGIYLSIKSGSRTGWFAVPIIIFLWLMQKLKYGKLKSIIISLLIALTVSVAIYSSSDIVKGRLNLMLSDIQNYDWDTPDPQKNYTSLGERITMTRIGWILFTMRPLTGWQDIPYSGILMQSEFLKYAQKETLIGLEGGGFHNQFIQNMVKFGIGGLLSNLAIFFVPMIIFGIAIQKNLRPKMANLGLAFVLTFFVGSLSYQILDFKFIASFYAMMVSLILGEIFREN